MNLSQEETWLFMKEKMSVAEGMAMPPKCFIEMGGRFIDYKENKSIKGIL